MVKLEELDKAEDIKEYIDVDEEIHKKDMCAIKLGVCNYADTLGVWYFYDRGSCIIGSMNENDFNPIFKVEGSKLDNVSERLDENPNITPYVSID